MQLGKFLALLKESRSYWRKYILKGLERIGNPAEDREVNAPLLAGLLYCGCICMSDLAECIYDLLCFYDLGKESDALENRCVKIMNRLSEKFWREPDSMTTLEVDDLVKAHAAARMKISEEIAKSLNKLK